MLTSGTPWKNILKFALPLMIANLLQQLYNTADTIIIGNFYSQNALAAVGACAYLTGLYVAIAIGLSLGLGVVVSQIFGRKDILKLKQVSETGTILLLGLGLLFAFVSYFSCESFLKYIISVPQEILAQSVLYAKIYSIGLFFQFGFNTFASVLRAMGNSKSSLYFLVITTVINIVLDLIFVAVFHFGVGGVAVATCISQFIAMLVSYLYLIKNYPTLKPSSNEHFFESSYIIKILKNGIPLTIQALIVNCGFMILQHIVNAFGVEMTASYTVSCRIELYMLVPFISILHAVATYSGQNYGAGNFKRLNIAVKQTVLMNLLLAFIIGIIVYTFADFLISLFALSGQSALYSKAHVRLASIDLLLYALYSPINGICVGIGKSYVLSIVSLVELCGRIYFAKILASFIGPACVWWSEPFAWIIVISGVYLFYNLSIRKQLSKK